MSEYRHSIPDRSDDLLRQFSLDELFAIGRSGCDYHTVRIDNR